MPAAVATASVKPTPLFSVGPRTLTGEATFDFGRRNPFETTVFDPKSLEVRARTKVTGILLQSAGFCPSCVARHMADVATHLVDDVPRTVVLTADDLLACLCAPWDISVGGGSRARALCRQVAPRGDCGRGCGTLRDKRHALFDERMAMELGDQHDLVMIDD